MSDNKENNESDTLQEAYMVYVERGDKESKDRLILKSLPLVKAIAERMAIRLPSHLDTEDLSSSGLIGLIDAIDRYDSSREAAFKTYASFRIQGAILDELRSLDWKPRSIRDKEKRIGEAYVQLERSLKRRPTDSEMADYLDVSMDQYYNLLNDTQKQPLILLDELMEDGSPRETTVSKGDPGFIDQIIVKEFKDRLVKAIDDLSEKERLSVTLYYYEGLTMKEVGQVLDVSESRISQIHSSAILHLRVHLQSVLN